MKVGKSLDSGVARQPKLAGRVPKGMAVTRGCGDKLDYASSQITLKNALSPGTATSLNLEYHNESNYSKKN